MLISDLHDLTDAVQWCDTCRGHKGDHCDDCHQAFLPSEPRYRSQTYHYHPAAIEGVAGVRSVQKELCVECYRLDHAKAYPNLAVPDLPDRGVDARFHAAQRTEANRAKLTEMIDALEKSGTATPEQLELLKRTTNVGLRFM